jgi:hypothetical protein
MEWVSKTGVPFRERLVMLAAQKLHDKRKAWLRVFYFQAISSETRIQRYQRAPGRYDGGFVGRYRSKVSGYMAKVKSRGLKAEI